MRIVFIRGHNSNFNSVLEVLKACRDFQYKSNSRISSDPPFWLRSFVVSWKGVFATSYCLLKFTSISCHEILSNFDNTHKSCFLAEFTQSVFWWKAIQLVECIAAKWFDLLWVLHHEQVLRLWLLQEQLTVPPIQRVVTVLSWWPSYSLHIAATAP